MRRYVAMCLAAAALIAGCDLDTADSTERHNAYVDAVNEANFGANFDAERLLADIEQARRPREARVAVERVIAAFDRAIVGLEEIDPLDEVREEHEALIAINRAGRQQFELMAELLYPGLEAEYAAAAPGVLGELSSLNREWSATIREINDAWACPDDRNAGSGVCAVAGARALVSAR